MATRLYFSESEAAPVTPPAAGAEWEHNAGETRKLLTAPDSSTLTTTAYAPDAVDHIADEDALYRQYVSDALEAQTLTGNVKAQLQCLEAHINNNLFLTMKILVISNDGTTVRDTLLAITRDTTTEIQVSPARNKNFPSTSLGSYACAAGDRLCVEIGVGGLPVAVAGTQGHNASLRFGCDASSGDLPEDDGESGTTYRPWIEFDATFAFVTEGGVLSIGGGMKRKKRQKIRVL